MGRAARGLAREGAAAHIADRITHHINDRMNDQAAAHREGGNA